MGLVYSLSITRRNFMNTELYYKAQEVKAAYLQGFITRQEAKLLIKPYEDYYNETSKRLANKYHQRYKPFSFAAFMR